MAWRKGALAAVALAAVTTGGLVLAALHPGDPATATRKGKHGGVVAVQGARVIRAPLTLTLPVVGHVASTYTVRITPGVAGTIAAVDAQLGQTVHTGQTLFTLTNPTVSLHAQIAAANAQAAQARLQQARQGGLPANIAQAKAALTMAEARLHALFQASPILVQRQVMLLQQAETQQGIAQANLQALQSGQAPQTVNLQNAQQALATLQAAANGQNGAPASAAVANLVTAQQALQAVESPQSPQGVAVASAEQAYVRGLAQTVTGSVYAENLQQQVNIAVADQTAAVQKAQQAVTAAQAQVQSQLSSAQAQVNVAQASQQLAVSNAEHALQAAQTNVSAQQANLAALQAGPSPATAQMAAAAVAAAQARVQAVEHPYTPATLESMQAAANAAQGNAQLAQITAGRLTVTAPVSGKLVAVNPALARVGATVGAGAALATLQSDILEVVGPVPQRDRTQVHPGQPAVIYSSAAPKRAIPAHVVGIAPTGNLASLTFQVTVAPDQPNAILATGEAAQVSLLTRRVAGATLVPTAALQTGSKGSFVYVLSPSKAKSGGSASGKASSTASSTSAPSTASKSSSKAAHASAATGAASTAKTSKTSKAAKTSKGRRVRKRANRAKRAAAGKGRAKTGTTSTSTSTSGSKRAKTLAGTVREVAVKTGYASGSWTQVRSGLKPGEVVLLPGSGSFLAAGDRVVVTMTRVPRPKAFPVRSTVKGAAGTVLSGAAGGGGAATGAKAGAGKKRVRRKGGKAAKGAKKAGRLGKGGGAAGKLGKVKLGGGAGGGGAGGGGAGGGGAGGGGGGGGGGLKGGGGGGGAKAGAGGGAG